MQRRQREFLQHLSLDQKCAFEANLQLFTFIARCFALQRFGLAFQHFLLTKMHSQRLVHRFNHACVHGFPMSASILLLR